MKTNILRSHGIKATELSNGIIIAEETDSVTGISTYTNITKWSIDKLYRWLGY